LQIAFVIVADVVQLVIMILACVVAVPLVYAALAKLSDRKAFGQALSNYGLFADTVRRGAMRVVPAVELATGVAVLLVGHWVSAVMAAAAYVVFGIVLFIAWRAGGRGECGCFGALSTTIGARAVGRATGLAMLAGVLATSRLMFPQESWSLADRLALTFLLIAGSALGNAAWSLRPVRVPE
jgi:hypothetical protein